MVTILVKFKLGRYSIDNCPDWVFTTVFYIMSLQQIDFSKTLTDDQVYDCIMNNYADLGKDWISHQWNWMNSVYWAFNDHYKYMIVISLIEKHYNFLTK